MKKSFYIAYTLFLILSLIGCGKNTADQRVKVAALIRTDSETFLIAYKNALIQSAAENNINLQVYFCNNDSAVQLDQVKNLLTNGVKYFVVIPVDTGLTEQIVRLIRSKGGAVAFSNSLMLRLMLIKMPFMSHPRKLLQGIFRLKFLLTISTRIRESFRIKQSEFYISMEKRGIVLKFSDGKVLWKVLRQEGTV